MTSGRRSMMRRSAIVALLAGGLAACGTGEAEPTADTTASEPALPAGAPGEEGALEEVDAPAEAEGGADTAPLADPMAPEPDAPPAR